MKTNLNFEQNDTKKLLSEFDFEYFLKQNIAKNNYTPQNIAAIHETYNSKLTELKKEKTKKQFNLYAEGQVRKMFTGGFLPAFFELDEGRGHTLFDFPAVGESWAYFKLWQKYQKKKITREEAWNIV